MGATTRGGSTEGRWMVAVWRVAEVVWVVMECARGGDARGKVARTGRGVANARAREGRRR